jgi:MYXO-CTERM domain-containing protein
MPAPTGQPPTNPAPAPAAPQPDQGGGCAFVPGDTRPLQGGSAALLALVLATLAGRRGRRRRSVPLE